MGLGHFKEFEVPVEDGEAVDPKPVPPPKKSGIKFLKGPIPWSWLTKVANLSGKALHVGIALKLLVGLRKTNIVKMQSARLVELGVSRQCYSRALKELEDAHLITVDRRPGQTPLVTVLDV
jgi:hypothetical protein